MVVTVFHWVDYDQPGRRDTRAICGQRVDRYREHSENPNCPTCVQLLAERRATSDDPADVFGTEAPGAPVHHVRRDPLADYRPKGARS